MDKYPIPTDEAEFAEDERKAIIEFDGKEETFDGAEDGKINLITEEHDHGDMDR